MIIDVSVQGNATDDLRRIQRQTIQTDTATEELRRKINQLSRAMSRNASDAQTQTRALSDSSRQITTNTKDMRGLIAQYVSFSLAINTVSASVKNFSDLEQKTLEIAKTTGLAGDELKKFTDTLNTTSQEIRGMKLDSLYEISAIAGQLGIKGKKDLLEFTLEIQKIAKTSKLTAQQAGEGFAQLSNSLQEPVSHIANLTSAFTALASSTTASEVDLLDYSQRLAGAGKTLELTSSQIIGIGATLKDVGITAEVGGTAISQVFLKIITNGKQMAERIGIDTDYFSKSIKEKPVNAVLTLLEAIGKLDKEAKVQALKDLQLSGSGLSSTLLKLSTNTDKLRANILTANEAYQDATATQDEFEIATRGLATTQEQFSDKLKLTSIALVSDLIPYLDATIKTMTSFLTIVEENKSSFLSFIGVIGGAVVAWKAFNLVMGLSPFGRIIIGLTAIIALAGKASMAIRGIESEYEVQQKIATQTAKNIKDEALLLVKAKKKQLKLLSQEHELTRSINQLTKSGKTDKVTIKILGIVGQRLNEVKARIADIKTDYKSLAEIKAPNAKVAKPNPRVTSKGSSIFVAPIIPPSKEAKRRIKEIEDARKASNRNIHRQQQRMERENRRAKKEAQRKANRLRRENESKNKRIKREAVRRAKDQANEIEKRQKRVDSQKAKATEAHFKRVAELKAKSIKENKSTPTVKSFLNNQKQESTIAISDNRQQLANLKEYETEQKRVLEQNIKAEKARIEELDRLESARLKKVGDFYQELNKTTLPKVQFELQELGKQRKEWLNIGVNGVEVQKLYNAKAKEIIKRDVIARANATKEKLAQLKLERDKTKELKKQNDKLGQFAGALGDVLKSSLLEILDEFSKTGKLNEAVVNYTQSGAVQDKLISSGNKYAMIAGVAGKIISGLLQSTIELDLNKGADNKSIERSLKNLETLQNPQNDFLKEISSNTMDMVQGFALVSKGLAGIEGIDGSQFEASFNNNDGITAFANALSFGLLGDDLTNAISSAFYNSTTELKNSGIRFAETTVAELDNIKAQSFQLIKETKSYLFGVISSSSDSLRLTDNIPSSVTDLVAESIRLGVENILISASELGIKNAQATADAIKISIGDLDLKGLNEEEINTLISGVLGNQIENIAQQVSKYAIEDFRRVGDDYYSTLLRVATQFTDAQQTLKDANIKSIESIKDISNTTGDVYAETIRESLSDLETKSVETITKYIFSFRGVDFPLNETITTLSGIGDIIQGFQGTGDEILSLYQSLIKSQKRLREISNTANVEVTEGLIKQFGGADSLDRLQNSFYDNFVSEQTKLEDLRNRLSDDIGFIPKTKEAYLELVKNIDLSTDIGKERYALLLKENEAFSDMIDIQDKLKDESKRSADEVKKAWDETYKGVQDSLTNTIKDILNIGKESNSKASLVQDIVNYNQLKQDLQREISKSNLDTEKINTLTSQLNQSAVGIGNNNKFNQQQVLATDLTRLRDSLPSQKVQQVEVINNDSATLTKILDSLQGENELSSKTTKLLNNILEELEN